MKITKAISLCLLLMIVSTTLYQCKEDETPGNSMDIIDVDPTSPASLEFNDFVVITYNYNILNPDGARMWIQPYTDGEKTPGYLYSSSKVYSGKGTRQVGISVEDGDGPVVVDQLRIIMTDPDQNETFLEQFINVEFTFDE